MRRAEGTKREQNAAFDAENAFSRLLSEVKYAETLSDTSSSADFMFSDLPQNAEIKMYTCESGSHPNELIMMKAAKEEDMQALETAAKTHLTELTAQLRDYNPQEVPKSRKRRCLYKRTLCFCLRYR